MSGKLALWSQRRIASRSLEDMDFLVLGPVEVEVGGERKPVGGPKQRSVLALLVANAGRPVSLDQIVSAVYGEDADKSIRRSVQTFVSAFRQDFGDVIHRRGDGYVLEADSDAIDAGVFEAAVAAAGPQIAIDPETASRSLRNALALWRGHPYADAEGRGVFEPEITRLNDLRLHALQLRIDADLAAGRHAEVVGELEALADEYPLREHFRAQHMLALYRSGRQTEALRFYQTARRRLAEETGLEPSPELRDLERKILQHDDDLLVGTGKAITQRLAFLVTDIEGSTSLWDRHPAAMADALAYHDRLLSVVVGDAGGTVFKHTGDGVLAVFSDVASAVRAAETGQRSLDDHDWGELGDLRVRMGIDVGEAEVRAGDFFGPPLNRASRLMAAGHGGQVLLSSSAQSELLELPIPGIQMRVLGEHRLRGLAAPERIAQLVFVGLQADFPDLRSDTSTGWMDESAFMSLPGYEVREIIDEGAFGIVYRAYQPAVGREVAIKVIRPDLAGLPSFVRRFEAEARTVAKLAHPRIVPLHDFWRDADGAYLVMRLLPGGNLAQTLGMGTLDPSVAVRVVHHVGEALDHAHAHGVIHGDLKPPNVLLDGEGNAFLSDFGIPARLLDQTELGNRTYSAPAYRAPEEATTGPSVLTDIFALGTLAYEVLTGRAPTVGSPVPPASETTHALPPALDPVLARATAANPADRFVCVGDFLAAFDGAVAPLSEAPAAVPSVARNPYKGLSPFTEADAADFFGRDDLVASLVAAVDRLRLVAVVGSSGSGKSSVVHAGLLPAVRAGGIRGSERWFVTTITPGDDPLGTLAEALERLSTAKHDVRQTLEANGLAAAVEQIVEDADTDLLLVIDQFEEIFTLVDDSRRQEAFLDLLADAATDQDSRLHLVLILRADFYDRPLTHDGLDRLVRDGLVTVLQPSVEELVEMITKPALAVGLRWEPGLPHRIAAEIRHQAGALPLLQYALTEIVERRSGDLLTSIDHDLVGGVTGALAARAEAVYGGLSPPAREAAREVLLRLVSVSEEVDDTRRRVRRSELESLGIESDVLDDVLDAFIDRRLFTTDRDPVTHGPTVEVSHEALLRSWPRLREWLENERVSLVLGRRLRRAFADWEAAERSDDYLLTGERLAPFRLWAQSAALTTSERSFFEASVAAEEAAAVARRRRRRVLTGILAGATVVAVALAMVASLQWRRADKHAAIESALAESETQLRSEAENLTVQAEDARDRAEEERDRALAAEALAQARALGASAAAALDTDPELALKLSALAVEADPTANHLTTLHSALQAQRPVVMSIEWKPERRPLTIMTGSMSRDGSLLGVSAVGNTVEVWEVGDSTGPRWTRTFGYGLGQEQAQSIQVWEVWFTDDNANVVVFPYWNPDSDEPAPEGLAPRLFVLDAATGEITDSTPVPRCFSGISQAPPGLDSPLFAGTYAEEVDGCNYGALTLGTFDLDTGVYVPITSPLDLQGADIRASMSRDGQYVAWGGNEGVVVDVTTGEQVLTFDGGLAALSADGTRIVVGGAGSGAPAEVLDVATGDRVVALDTDITSATFGGPGDSVVVASADGAIRLYDASSGDAYLEIPSTDLDVDRHLSADGTRLETLGESIQVLDVADTVQGEVAVFETGMGGFHPQFGLDTGGTFASMEEIDLFSGRFQVTIFDSATGAEVAGLGALSRGPLSADGTKVAISPMIEDVELDEEQTGGAPGIYQTTGPVRVVDLADESFVEMQGLCRWYNGFLTDNAVPGPECASYPDPFMDPVGDIALSGDASKVAIAGLSTGRLTVWDAANGAILWRSDPLERNPELAFDPSAEHLVVTTQTHLRVFDGETGALVYDQSLQQPVKSLTFSADGTVLYGRQVLTKILSWDTAKWKQRPTVGVQPSTDLAMSPDGTLLAASGWGHITILDTTTGATVQTIPLPSDFIPGVEFIDQQHLLAVPVGGWGPALVFTLDPAELVDIARSRATRDFTPEECATYNLTCSET